MDPLPIYVLISIITLAIIAFFVFRYKAGSSPKRLSMLASLSLIFVLAGIFLEREQLLRYALLGIGVLLAIADLITKSRAKS